MTRLESVIEEALSEKSAHVATTRPAFARHETFHPRFGWLKKGFDAARREPETFVREDAPILLGVGKNMVRAIRYWCLAFKVLAEFPNLKRPRVREAHPTDFGQKLLSDDGWDPYLEYPGSLWLLHWQLLRPPCLAPAWFAAFHVLRAVEFSDAELLAALVKYRNEHEGLEGIVEASLKKDALCIVRMYAATAHRGGPVEDSLDSPFSELGLLRPLTSKQFQFNIGEKSDLPDDIIVHACLDYAAIRESTSQTLSIRRLTYDVGSPGSAFKLTESALSGAIERYSQKSEAVAGTEAAGVAQMVYRGNPAQLASQVLIRMYQGLRKGRRI